MRVRDDLNHFQVTRPPIAAAQRIAFIGCSGSGKTTLAATLAELTGLPHICLDQLFWKPGWVMANEAEAQARAEAVATTERWIIEGNYGASFPNRLSRADLVVWFDFPTWFCLYRVLRRIWTHYGKVRPMMPEGCPERLDWEFLNYIRTYRTKQRPKLLKAMDSYVKDGTIVRIHNEFGLRSFVEAMRVFVATSTDEPIAAPLGQV